MTPEIRLKSLKYCERQGKDLAWSLDHLVLGQFNLLVGKNATGKTRAINVIGNLANTFLREGNVVAANAGYEVEFSDGTTTTNYELIIEDGNVKRERLAVDGKDMLVRDSNRLKIYAVEEEKNISFIPSPTQIAAVARRDELQHPFLNPLHAWADAVRIYHFGANLGKDSFSMTIDNSVGNIATNLRKLDDRHEDAVVATFSKAQKEYGGVFVQRVITDMKSLGYDLLDIDVSTPAGVKLQSSAPVLGVLNAIAVMEAGVQGWIHQNAMSQGMFRAFSIIAQVNYSQLASRATCILIDDIGEGLDFDRSSRLIEVLREKSQSSDFQLIMTTNDRFVMNHVPLDEWSVLQRTGAEVKVKNVHNSREQFEEFKFIGMSNFSLLEMDFLNEATVGAESDVS